MDAWILLRFLHLLAVAVFVGGQIVLVAAIVPALRGRDDEALRAIARRFGVASVVALAVLVATGAALAEHFDRWDEGTLQVKLGLVVTVVALTGLHAVVPRSRPLSIAIFAASLAIVWLGASLAH